MLVASPRCCLLTHYCVSAGPSHPHKQLSCSLSILLRIETVLLKSIELRVSIVSFASLNMSGTSDYTPLMADTDHMHCHDEIDGQRLKALPSNAYFKFTLKAFTIIISLLSLVNFCLLMATHAWISVGPFNYTSNTQEAIRDLVICVSHFFIYSILSDKPFYSVGLLILTMIL